MAAHFCLKFGVRRVAITPSTTGVSIVRRLFSAKAITNDISNVDSNSNPNPDEVRNTSSEVTSYVGSNVDKVTHTGQIWSKDDYRRVRFIDKDKLINERFAIDYIEEDPVIVVKDRNVVASGGGGALGHPKVFINLDRDEVAVCGYSGRKFIQEKFYRPEKHGPSISYEDFLEEEPL